MKKIFSIALAAFLVFGVAGCEKVGEGNYKEGTYLGAVEYESYGEKYVTTAVVYVNESGMIKSVNLDSTYKKEDVITTKKALGDAYGMKSTSAGIGKIEGGAEWYEQVAVIEDKVVAEQGLDWVKWNTEDATKLDGVSGCTISADTYIQALTKALDQAK